MNRIASTFARLREEGRTGLVGFLTAGDPDYMGSLSDLRTAAQNGVDILEIGVPFSDATADGPTIQESSQRALATGMNLARVLDLVRELRKDYDLPIILFGYANPFFHYGYEKLASEAVQAGVDGFLVVDLPHEEVQEFDRYLLEQGLAFINLIAPTTPEQRAGEILRNARGFVYYIMVTGVTGTRTDAATDVDEHVRNLRGVTELPVAVGFGVSSGEQARQVGQTADAVVVGSALVRAARAGQLANLLTELRRALQE